MGRSHLVTLVTILGVSTLGVAGCSVGGASDSALTLETLSTRPWLVTGGDVLVRVALADGVDPAGLEVVANGVDVTDAFRPSALDGTLFVVAWRA